MVTAGVAAPAAAGAAPQPAACCGAAAAKADAAAAAEAAAAAAAARVHVHSAARLPLGLLDALRRDAPAIARAPNFWVPRKAIEAGGGGGTAADAAVAGLYAAHMAPRLADSSWEGAEYWVQVYQPGRGLAFHFDKDEQLLVEEGAMAHPVWSSVLYLTGDDGEGAAREGPTVVIDQVFDQALGRPVPEDPSSCVLVYPRAGAYCVFDGRLGHGVLDSFAPGARATLLVNWWAARPRGVRPATVQQLAGLGIGPLRRAGCQQGGAGSDGPAGNACAVEAEAETVPAAAAAEAETVPAPAAAEAAAAAADGGAAAALEALTLSSSSDAGCGGGGRRACSEPPGGAAIPEVAAPAAAGLDRAVLVDDLLRGAGLALTGPRAASAVRIRHPGLVLLPLDPEQVGEQQQRQQAQAGLAAPRLQTAAAFVPPSMLPCDSEASSGEGSSTSCDEEC
ncbi:hypothetical protein Rsub_07104 [Raphidocelis subcapitata]|uniref:Uncharacterized protein n=1 Tax=Raphidocelis subcapitata TaxID=307507 RepID=A0A2V0PAC2_9CHLO|nr:hypothetical protein Rsub_07104 [Raphidocelis subcapitata]|eukprot:GBF94117.1 hypothetical protein Rsub_07104 [Raphidocelis subcapitata]